MRLTPAPAFHAPKTAMPQPHFGAAAKPPSVKAPKIAAVKIRPLNAGGLEVTHSFPAPHPAKQFVFASPTKMVQHLRRIEDTAWLHPNTAKDARRTVQVLNAGEEP